MFRRVFVFLMLCVPLMGCGREGSQTNVPRAEQAERSSTAEVPERDLTGVLAELTQASRKFGAEQRRVPNSLDELVTAGYLKEVPAAPSGKKFVIDPKELKVTVK